MKVSRAHFGSNVMFKKRPFPDIDAKRDNVSMYYEEYELTITDNVTSAQKVVLDSNIKDMDPDGPIGSTRGRKPQ